MEFPNLKTTYDAIVDLQKDLRFELQAATTVADADYQLVKALAATMELQEYLANRIAEARSEEEWRNSHRVITIIEGEEPREANLWDIMATPEDVDKAIQDALSKSKYCPPGPTQSGGK